jgi:hypothetical protein
MWLLLCWSHRLRVVRVGRGCWSRFIENHAVSFGNLFVICYIVWFCTVFMPWPHIHIRYLEYVYFITGEEEDVTVHFIILSMYKFVYEKLQHTTSTCTNLIQTVLLYFFDKTLFSAKYPFRIRFNLFVFNATFSNISAISWRPVLVVEEAVVPGKHW